MVQTAIVAADRLNDILEIETEAFDEITDFHQKWNELKIENIDFRYGNRELTLKNLSLKIKKGEKIAIIGESGSGKTTLAKLLMRFYTPESGDIFFDDTSIKDMNVSDIRQRIAYVDQNTFLFSDTVKNNLLIGSPNATDEEINTACEKANAKEFIEKLPFGLDTFLDENGQSLSGGQRQRLAIARALLKKPQILILDEATSNLDTITEAGIKNTLLDIDSSITYIVIAHRLSTIKGCDRIIVMDDSEIIEQGTHDELMAKKGKYHSFYKRQ